ncbi:hypothetical protein [Amycolatopsis sp. NPDC098790]|uniref:hypothetical protein n=1 Tax=Amycolatopsis sp. NPDC098790 TaxID=3363939 RepID=UPI003827FED1
MSEFVVGYAVAVAVTMAILTVATLLGRAARANLKRLTFSTRSRHASSAVTEPAMVFVQRIGDKTTSIHRHRATPVRAGR